MLLQDCIIFISLHQITVLWCVSHNIAPRQTSRDQTLIQSIKQCVSIGNVYNCHVQKSCNDWFSSKILTITAKHFWVPLSLLSSTNIENGWFLHWSPTFLKKSGAKACFTIWVHFVFLHANFAAISLSGNIFLTCQKNGQPQKMVSYAQQQKMKTLSEHESHFFPE